MLKIWRHQIFGPAVSVALTITIVRKGNCWILNVQVRVQFQVFLHWIFGDTKD
jgi:hypothetical protein